MMLRVDEYRHVFIQIDGISALVTLTLNQYFQLSVISTNVHLLTCSIISVLPCKIGFQMQYQLVFCLWVMSFNPRIAEHMRK